MGKKELGLDGAYVYEIIVDGVVRYVGKGRGPRKEMHLTEARRILRLRAAGEVVRTTRLYNGLAAAIRRGLTIEFNVVASGLSDEIAYETERNAISSFAPRHLWNILPGGLGGDPGFFAKFWSIEENRRKASARAKLNWKRDGFRENQVAKMAVSCTTPEFRERRSDDMKSRFQDAEYKLHHSKLTKERRANNREQIASAIQAGKERARHKFSAATKKKWLDPEWRAKLCAAQKARWTPEARILARDKMRAKFSDPNYHAVHKDRCAVAREKRADEMRPVGGT